MATTLSRNLKLRIDSNLTANAKYNLERIDLLGSTFLVDTTDSLNVRSKSDINIEPNSPDLDGSGILGSVNVGNTSHAILLNIYSSQLNIESPVGILDAGLTGTKYLRIGYNSTLSGSVDNAADRALTVDLDGADRQLVLAGNLKLFSGNLSLTSQNASSAYNLPAGAAGTLATIANVESFTNKTIDADQNTLLNVRNANVAASAAIAYSKLNLANSIVNADINTSAGIVYSKLSLANSIINNDINSAAGIAYSKLNLTASITNSDLALNAAIDYSKLNLTGQVKNSDIASGAAIDGSKINPDFGSQIVNTSASLKITGGTHWNQFQTDPAQASNIFYTLPNTLPAGNQLLRANASTPTLLEWASVSGTGTVTSVSATVPAEFSVSGVPITSAGTIAITSNTQSANSVWAGPTSGGPATPAFRPLATADLPTNTLVGVTDTASVDLTIAGNSLSAAVLPAGVNHNALQNYVASQHVDHAAVAINTGANSGMSGGGDIQLSRSILVDPTNAISKATPQAADSVLIADSGAGGALKKATLGSIASAVGGGVFATNWIGGTSFTATHNFGSKDVDVIIYDTADGSRVYPDTEIRSTTNAVDLTASSAPGNWRVLVKLLI